MIPQDAEKYLRSHLGKGGIVCLTGAGISAESGIPTFRGKGGLWEKYDPEIYAYGDGLVKAFRTHPEDIVDFIIELYSVLLQAKPNKAHLGLALLEKQGILDSVITQNVDNLHQAAGSRQVIELHGNALRIRCASCRKAIFLEKDRIRELLELLRINRGSRIALLKVFSRYFCRCRCGGRFRIDVVLFGEMLPEEELQLAYSKLQACQMFLLIGTSLVVYPAADLPLYAKERGAKLIEINHEPTALSGLCDYHLRGQATEVLPEILNILES